MRSRNAVTMLCLVAAALILIPPGGRSSAQTEREKALGSLVEAERAFAKTSEEKGIREAFLAWLAPDATVFRPGPVPGRSVYEKMDPANPALLTWEPQVAEVAASGEMGYTSGPYVIRPRRDAEPTGCGHYVSIWKRQPDGAWRVFLDAGISYGRPATLAPITEVAAPRAEGPFEALSLEAHRDEGRAVANRSGEFDAKAHLRGYRRALAEFAMNDIRIYRPGRMPAVGKALIKNIIPDGAAGTVPLHGPVIEGQRFAGETNFQVEVAWSGDLAATYGTADRPDGRSAAGMVAFLKIWRKDAASVWKICLDLEIPVPAGKQEEKD